MGFFEKHFRGRPKVPDYREEYASETFKRVENVSRNNSYSENGVRLKDNTRAYRLVYDGLLAKSGAADVYAVVGRGENGNWRDVQYYPMHAAGRETFELLLPVSDTDNVSVVFKDGADHWDNNSGANYTFTGL